MDKNEIINLSISFFSAITVIFSAVFTYIKFKKEFKHIKQEFQNSKRVEESNHRQKWLDDFRNDVALYFNVVSSIINFSYVDNKKQKISELYSSHHMILLKLNPKNQIDKEIEYELDKLTYNLKSFEIFNINKEKFKLNELIKIVTDKNLYFNLDESIEIKELIMANKAYEENREKYQNPDGTFEYIYLIEPEILDKHYDVAYENVVKKFKDSIEEELKYHKNQMHLKFRVYLKAEWERIKALICDDSFNFETEYQKIFYDLSMDKVN